jgi:hypothetical protein
MPTVVKVVGGYLEVDMGSTGQPPYPSQGPGFPTHPIAPGGQPPYPSQGPGFPTHPIAPGGQPPHPSQGPGFPTHPISPGGPGGGGEQPPGIWGGTPPIYIDIGPPGQQPEPPEDESKIEWHTGWSAEKGWVTVGIVTPEGPIPTPSS